MFKNVSSEHQPEQMRKIDRLVSEVTDAEEIKKSIDIPDVEGIFYHFQNIFGLFGRDIFYRKEFNPQKYCLFGIQLFAIIYHNLP